MPPKKQYRPKRPMKNAPVKRVAKKVVARQRQKKVELKDRISRQITSNSMYQGGPDVVPIVEGPTNGPANTLTIVPSSWIDPFTTGTQNGQIVGTEITPKYLNLKMKLNFDFLRRVIFTAPNGSGPAIQRYDITILQGWIKQTLREDMVTEVTNAESGWSLPAFGSKADWETSVNSVVNREMYNNGIQAEFLTYRQKSTSNLQIIKKKTIKGHQDEQLNTGSEAVDLNPLVGATPEQNHTFNWDLSKMNKTKMAPIGSGSVVDPTRVLGFSWIPFVQVRIGRLALESTGSTEGPNANRSALLVSHVDHFTYSDS